MREILFRGKDIVGNWYIGNLAVAKVSLVNGAVKPGSYISNECGSPFAYQVRPETVGQFTGLLDMNGKKIFEGDIIDDDRELYAVVTYFESISSFLAQSGSTTWNLNEGNPNRDCKLQYTEVVGNIHDNPELLEVK